MHVSAVYINHIIGSVDENEEIAVNLDDVAHGIVGSCGDHGHQL